MSASVAVCLCVCMRSLTEKISGISDEGRGCVSYSQMDCRGKEKSSGGIGEGKQEKIKCSVVKKRGQ